MHVNYIKFVTSNLNRKLKFWTEFQTSLQLRNRFDSVCTGIRIQHVNLPRIHAARAGPAKRGNQTFGRLLTGKRFPTKTNLISFNIEISPSKPASPGTEGWNITPSCKGNRKETGPPKGGRQFWVAVGAASIKPPPINACIQHIP